MRRYVGSFVRYQAVCMIAVRKARPIDSGTKKKWKIVVMANCHRARSNASMRASSAPPAVDAILSSWRGRSARSSGPLRAGRWGDGDYI